MPADLKSQIFDALIMSWGFIVKLAPYLIGGILIAALVNTFVSRHSHHGALVFRESCSRNG